MATKAGQEKTSGHGVKIDTNLIPTTSGDDALRDLGVSVYNQDEFEAGVLHQIDTEVQRRNKEQVKGFLVKEYNTVQAELKSVQVELKNISKKIAGLLTQPLSTVILKLRELRASQDNKRSQIATLQAREHSLLRKLSGKEDSLSSDLDPSSGVRSDTERQRLIQTGLITPFDKTPEATPTLTLPPDVTTPSTTDHHSSSITGSRLDSITPDSLVGPVNSDITWGVKQPRPSPTLQLSNDNFDGLFSDLSASTTKLAKKRSGKSSKGKDSMVTDQPHPSHSSNSSLLIPSIPANDHTTETDDVMISQAKAEPDFLGNQDIEDWIPTIEELENFDSEDSYGASDYYTDEELGVSKPKRKRALRPLSSDDLESEDECSRPRKKKGCVSGRGKRYGNKQESKHLDDGDEQLYRMRMSEVDSELGAPCEDDMVFDGGLRIPGSIWNKLYRYQQTGVKWLWELHCQQAGGVVGDEMGLGKTIQMVSFLAGLQVSCLRSHTTRELGLGPCLIVCPATIMHQWVSEFHTWWPPFRVAILHDTGTYTGDKSILVSKIVKECGVLVTTYAGIRIYQDILLRHKWDYVVLDEGHKIRNPDAALTLACKQFPTPHRIILSGSPMQNNLRELWSLFDFVFPGKLGTLPVFMEQFSVPITMGGYANATDVQVQTAYRCACVLRDTINPYLLRRMKADVKVQLPDKNEQVLFCRLTDYQHDVYSDYLKGPDVERALAGRKQVFSALTALRKLCNHPDLVTNDYRVQVVKKDTGQHTSPHKPLSTVKKLVASGSGSGEEVYGYYKRSGKMIVVHSLLRLWHKQGHRVLLFSQTKMMLDIMERFVVGEGYSYVRMDGGTPVATRQPLVRRYNEDASIFVFLLTTRVGGLGVNLIGANRVILYDPDWNPSTDTQARERAWRIGQTRHVTVYRLLTSGTIEEKIYHRQIFKQFLTNRVLKDPRQRRFFKSNDIYDLFSLDSNAKDGSTETSAIFAGTGSEVTPKRAKRSSPPTELQVSRGSNKKTKKRKTSTSRKNTSVKATPTLTNEQPLPASESMECEPSATITTAGPSELNPNTLTESPPVAKVLPADPSNVEKPTVSAVSLQPLVESQPSIVSDESPSVRKKSKKKRKHKRRERGLVDGVCVEGVESSCLYQPGSGDEESGHKQDDFILKKLFKKTGVHSAMQHDVIMNSADPDYVLVETEANKVAQSAARAIKASRRQCQSSTRWGRPTWTGTAGVAGAPGLGGGRFGESSRSSVTKQQSLFTGQDAGTTSSAKRGSLQTSSSLLLAKMRSRNANTAITENTLDLNREVQASGIHGNKHEELLKEMRDFIATQCKVDGQASTAEILAQFSSVLPQGETALFRSLLRQICDFSRHHGDGLWSLKPEFR